MDELHGLKGYRIATEEDRKGPKPEGTMWLRNDELWTKAGDTYWLPVSTYAVPIDCPLEGWEECTEREWRILHGSESFRIPDDDPERERYFRRKRVSQTITAELCGDELRFGDHVFKEAT